LHTWVSHEFVCSSDWVTLDPPKVQLFQCSTLGGLKFGVPFGMEAQWPAMLMTRTFAARLEPRCTGSSVNAVNFTNLLPRSPAASRHMASLRWSAELHTAIPRDPGAQKLPPEPSQGRFFNQHVLCGYPPSLLSLERFRGRAVGWQDGRTLSRRGPQ